MENMQIKVHKGQTEDDLEIPDLFISIKKHNVEIPALVSLTRPDHRMR